MFLGRWQLSAAVLVSLSFGLIGCSDDDSRPMRDVDGSVILPPGVDGGMGDGGGPISGCDSSVDTDGDGISDADEAGMNICSPPDSDGDGTPDFADTDSDNDGLDDAAELAAGTDPTDTDSDDDGITDFAEVEGSGTDPLDPASTIPPGDFFVVLPYEGERENRTLRFGTDIAVADVYFLVDMTGSMRGERTNLINGLIDTIIPGIEAAIENVQFGAGGFDDYPTGGYGGGNDLPFYNLKTIGEPMEDIGGWSLSAGPTTCPSNAATNDIGMIVPPMNGRPDILEAVEGLPCHGGSDGPESYVPALYATATGMGLPWPGGSIPAQSCPVRPDEMGRRIGYPCFRPGALPIVLIFGDNSFHNGPTGGSPYSFSEAPSYDMTVTALRSIGARVIGLYSGGSTYRADYEAIARDTGTVDGAGDPLVFDIGTSGEMLTTGVVDAVASLVGGTPQDVSTRTENVAGNPDGFDATTFIKSITPVEGYRDGIPGTGYDSYDETTFYGVIPGTLVDFEIDFWNDVRPPAPTAELFQARIVVVGNGVADLDSRNVYIIVPPEGGTILI